ncbi:MAG: VWA domain-containing protein [Verrucomicrobiales bacterium]|jgi:Ca-activated chloride channel family protein|nr:VWA domain-containing protein [Verrucomicrobiales bacterium]
MTFAAPNWLYAGLTAAALLAGLFWWADRQRRRALAALVSRHLLAALTVNFSPRRRLAKRVLFISGVACLFVALARPQYGHRWQEVKRKGIDLVVAVDVSRSMLSEDVKPNRLERAKLAIRDLAELADGDRLALIPFAGSAYVMCPPTLDYDMFLQSLDALSPDVMPLPGTDLAAALQASGDLLDKAAGGRKIVLLFTDGEDLEGAALAAAKRAAARDIVIYTVGVGTAAGDLIPVTGSGGGVDFLKDESGKIVKSRLDESTLKKIAGLTGGAYILQNSRGGVEELYHDKIKIIPKQELSSRMEKIPLERFVWPLLAGIALLAAEFLTRERTSPWFTRKATLMVTLLGVSLSAAQAAPLLDERDQKTYSRLAEKYAAKSAGNPDDPVLHYNLGTANYKLGHYEAAADEFQKALSAADVKLQNFAYYNLGNAQYRRGEPTEKTDPEKTRNWWRQSVQAYQGALQLDADDAQARQNLEFVQKRLNELPPPQQNQDEKNQDDKKDGRQNDQPQQNQQQNSREQNRQNKDVQDPRQQQSGADGDQRKKQGADHDKNQQNQPPDQKPDGERKKDDGQRQPNNADDEKKTADHQRPSQPAKSGGLTKEQARAALDALKGEEKPYNIMMPNYRSADPQTRRQGKDW